ncbi:MAG: pyridine nucleotide-disulfide oxidoreductase, partial [Bacilli bacterium]|nr:pyridine nucleotide-disulfide oxidoreductase [Bacilli bacterium]
VDESLQTSIKGIFACGNSLHVHDLVDFVTSEGSLAGQNAAKYIKGELKEGKYVNITNGNGVGYVLPQSVELENIEKIKISFRVTKPFKDVKLNIYQGDKLIKKLPKPYLVPAEMENILLDKALIENEEDIKVEVSNE